MQNDERQIRDVVATWMEATKVGDTETVLSLMTDDVVFLVPGHPPMIGRAAFAAAARSEPGRPRPQFEGTSEIQEVQVAGEWAFMWSRLRVVGTPADGSAPSIRAGHTLSIFRKENGRWRLARDANMLAPVADSREA
jgi:uncharacterized protein (TIGR02246 family)